jgi:hypothetical protein
MVMSEIDQQRQAEELRETEELSQIDELRQILAGESAGQLAALKQRIEDIVSRTRDVAEVLAPAIRKTDTKALVSSLQGPVSLSLKQAIRSEPQEYAEILYPMMAPSIRRAISQAISSLLVTINRTVASATSVNGLKTRFQSIRTGIPYAELVLRQSLLYRVEHVYLIDRESGMQITEIAAQDTEGLDGDAVSGMMSAIQSFVQDSFSQDPTAMLTDFKVGDYNVWVAHGPKLMLACVILGDAPEGLKDDLNDALYKIRTDYANQIADFDGDVISFNGVDVILQPLMQLRLKEGGGSAVSSSSQRNSIPFILVGLVLLYFGYQWFAHNNKLSTVEYFLRQAPGIAATDIYWKSEKLIVEGLKDPDAKVPYGALEAYGIEPQVIEFRTIPFRSLQVEMELQRFGNELRLPSGVSLAARDGLIFLYGEAPMQWLNSNDARILQLAADNRLTISELSVSRDSVLDLLNTRFISKDLKDMLMSSAARGELTVIEIGGTFEASKLALVSALFAGNRWVVVTAKQHINQRSDIVPNAAEN